MRIILGHNAYMYNICFGHILAIWKAIGNLRMHMVVEVVVVMVVDPIDIKEEGRDRKTVVVVVDGTKKWGKQ